MTLVARWSAAPTWPPALARLRPPPPLRPVSLAPASAGPALVLPRGSAGAAGGGPTSVADRNLHPAAPGDDSLHPGVVGASAPDRRTAVHRVTLYGWGRSGRAPPEPAFDPDGPGSWTPGGAAAGDLGIAPIRDESASILKPLDW